MLENEMLEKYINFEATHQIDKIPQAIVREINNDAYQEIKTTKKR